MRHRCTTPKLGRTASHRDAMLRNMVTDLFRHEKVRTTQAKAKVLRPYAEKLITLGKRETLHARRRAARLIRDKLVLRKLFDDLAPRYAERPGGYTRITKLPQRAGDNAHMALIELVEAEMKVRKSKPKKRGGPRTAAQDTVEATAEPEVAAADESGAGAGEVESASEANAASVDAEDAGAADAASVDADDAASDEAQEETKSD